MNERQLLHIKLMEECGETTQRVSKLLRFGELEIQDEYKINNFDRTQEEILDIIFTAGILGYRIVLTDGQITHRRERLNKYTEKSRMLKILD